MRKILVTSALPYANGAIHLGHLVEYIQTDIWVRAMRAQSHQVTYVCADDAHGTAIMLKAEANGITPEAQIANVQQEHERDFAGFLIGFDHYDSTNSVENLRRAQEIYIKVRDKGHIAIRPVRQLFDPEKNLFLADRFIKGECPKCGEPDQYGDNCEKCNATYNATDLKNSFSTLSGATPIEKESEHYFFKLADFTDFLKTWTRSQGTLQSSVANKLGEWLEAGLSDWDISRDAPYFGFEIPDAPNKYFYVWLDAPIGYMSSFERLCQTRDDLDWNEYWQADSKTELYHFIGKDIVNFHGLFWPAMLSGAGYRTPTSVFVHGHLMVNGAKMSKSRGTFINAQSYLEHLNPEYLRYYYASKLSESVEDIDLNLEDFIVKVNSDLVGKVVNIASRCAGFISKKFDGKLSATCSELALLDTAINAGDSIAKAYEAREFSRAVREIMALADLANQYIDDKKPWALAKIEGKESEVQDVCSVGLNLFRQLMVYLAPILPSMAEQAMRFLNLHSLDFNTRTQLLLDHQINPFEPLMQRVDKDAVAAMVEASKDSLQPLAPTNVQTAKPKTVAPKATPEASAIIDIGDFAKVDIRVGKILAATTVEGSDKLLALTIDVGEAEPRNILSGIRGAYAPEALIDRLTLVIVNLAPRKMRFGISNGMVLAAGNASGIYLLSPDDGALAGDRVS